MRVLHVNKFLYRRGGAEAYMEDLAALQGTAGHEVAYFGMAHPENPALDYQAFFPPYLDFAAPAGGAPGKIRVAGRMLWSTSAKRGMEAVVERFRPDVVHLHNIYHQLSPSVLRPLRERGIPSVMTLHDYKLACPTYLFTAGGQPCEACLGGKFHNAVLRRCQDGSLLGSALAAFELFVHTTSGAYDPVGAFVCPSRFLQGKMAAAGVFPDRLHHVPHFVDAAGVRAKARPGGPVVFAGRLSEEKGLDVLIDAVGLLGGVRLEVLGDGPERAALEARATERAPGRVHFHGRLPRTRVLETMRSAVAVAVPSRVYENQPLAVLEAFACGVPVVGSDLGGIPELIGASCGLVVPASDPPALAGALGSLVADPDRAMAMGADGRRRVEAEFSPEVHLARLDEIYAAAGAAAQARK